MHLDLVHSDVYIPEYFPYYFCLQHLRSFWITRINDESLVNFTQEKNSKTEDCSGSCKVGMLDRDLIQRRKNIYQTLHIVKVNKIKWYW